MKLSTFNAGIHVAEIEAGETLKINFTAKYDDAQATIEGMTIGTMVLPGGNVAIVLHFHEENLFVAKPSTGQTPILVVFKGMGADKLEFTVSEESGSTLQLSKADLRRLLDEGQLEYPSLCNLVR